MLQEKILTGKRLFTGEMLDHLIADVSEKSKMKFDVKIETDKLVYSVSPGRVAIAAAPVKSEKKNLQGWRDSAVVFF